MLDREKNKTEKIFYYNVNNGCMITYYNFVSYMNEYTAGYAILEELKARYFSAETISVYNKFGTLLCSYHKNNELNKDYKFYNKEV